MTHDQHRNKDQKYLHFRAYKRARSPFLNRIFPPWNQASVVTNGSPSLAPHFFRQFLCFCLCLDRFLFFFSPQKKKKGASFFLTWTFEAKFQFHFFLPSTLHARTRSCFQERPRQKRSFSKENGERRERERERMSGTNKCVSEERGRAEKEKQKVVPNSKLRKQRDKVQKTF